MQEETLSMQLLAIPMNSKTFFQSAGAILFLCFLGCRENINDDSITFTTTVTLSVSSEGILGDNSVEGLASLSSTGRFTAFTSQADNLVAENFSSYTQIFVRDTLLGTTELISKATSANGSISNRNCTSPNISTDGRWVAFVSEATNLSEYTTERKRIYLRDRLLNNTHMITRNKNSADANDNSEAPSLCTLPGKVRIAFASDASDLLSFPVFDNNSTKDIFYRDFIISSETLNGTEIVSRITGTSTAPNDDWQTSSTSTSENPAISNDGNYIAFESTSKNLADTTLFPNLYTTSRIFRREITAVSPKTVPISLQDGAFVSGSNDPLEGLNPCISANGMIIAFQSADEMGEFQLPDNGIDIYIRDVSAEQTHTISLTNTGAVIKAEDCINPALSHDGNRVTFETTYSGFFNTDQNGVSDIFLHDRTEGKSSRVSIATYGQEASGSSTYATISPNGDHVAFQSVATNLSAEADYNGVSDFFQRGAIE